MPRPGPAVVGCPTEPGAPSKEPGVATRGPGGAECGLVLSSTEGFTPGPTPVQRAAPGTRRMAPPGSSRSPAPLRPRGPLEGLLVPVCPAVCACAEVRPLLCLVCATPLHVCVYTCVSVGAHLPA